MSDPIPLPRPPALPAQLRELTDWALEPESLLEQASLGDCELSAAVAAGVALRECRLLGTRLAGATLEGLELTDVELSGCDLANLRAGPHGGFIRVRARNCRMTGLTFTDGVLRDVMLHGCRVGRASFGCCELVGAAGLWAHALGIWVLDETQDEGL